MSIALVGGSSLASVPELDVVREHHIDTRYGNTSGPILEARLGDRPLLFLSRHGNNHHIAPHAVNYRANIAALKQLGATAIIAVNAVGGIASMLGPGALCLPDQLIDYTHSRPAEYAPEAGMPVQHIDFTWPFSGPLREQVRAALQASNTDFVAGGTYGCTQGPRLETAAEIQKLRRDGCDMVGMTAMPEAILARQLGMDYASVCLVVNWAAGLAREPISMAEIRAVMSAGAASIVAVIAAVLAA